MKSYEIRDIFINFFQNKGHTYAEPSPIIPQNDPTLLFINAGMNQFKDVFLGKGTRSYKRAVNSQICIRVSGKHNDLEEVGKDTYHQTLFEMLGNWSFGDYYKKEAISWSWELITEVFHLPKDKLYATVYETDEESAQIWTKVTDIDTNKILKFGKKYNFWEMAETGPCGPCSEIHIDRGEDACDMKNVKGHICQVNGDCSRFIELWNLVFVEFDKQSDGKLIELPNKHVDTGMGLERIVAYIQKTTSNYETDLFQPIIKKIEDLTGIPYSNDLSGMPHRVMADHIRTIAFAIADNVMPSNEGRGYVIRRILRRGLRYAKKLNISEPILYKLVDPLAQIMGNHFKNILMRKKFIENLIKSEEENFLRTLDNGIILFEQISEKALKQKSKIISGKDVFKLYDTYGFPADLTMIMAKEKNLTININEFEQELEKQRKKSRSKQKLQTSEHEIQARGGEARVVTDAQEKLNMARHHTATHLLQASLRKILGDHVYQAGSLVETSYLRFDFTHFQPLTSKQILEIEKLVNNAIQAKIDVNIKTMNKDEAIKTGAMSLFGEKYGQKVTVVTIGDFSMELCGGNHVKNTAQLQAFKIISETGISAGTRRIVAITGSDNINNYFVTQKKELIKSLIPKISKMYEKKNKLNNLKIKFDIPINLENLQDLELETLKHIENQINLFNKKMDKIIMQEQHKNAQAIDNSDFEIIKPISSDINFYIQLFDNKNIQFMRIKSDSLMNYKKNLICILIANTGQFLIKIPSTIITKYQITAPQIKNIICNIAGGSGGGKDNLIQGGGLDINKFDMIKSEIQNFIKKSL